MGRGVWNAEQADFASDILVVVVLMRQCECSLLLERRVMVVLCHQRGDTRVEVLALSVRLFPHSSALKQAFNLHVLHSKSEALVKL